MESSKLYKTLGHKLGYNPIRYSQRGIIAKNILRYIDTLELQEFKKNFKKINILSRGIKINNGNDSYYI